MTDIVERLRSMPAPLVLQNIDENYLLAMQLCGESADEIERLRSWLINIQIDISGISDVCGRIADQVEKVRLGVSDD